MPKLEVAMSHVWHSTSNVDSESDCESISSDENSPQTQSAPKGGVPAVLPTMLPSDSDSDSDQEDDRNRVLKPCTAPKREPLQLSFKPAEVVSSVSKVISKLPPPGAAPRGQKGLVEYLRKENGWLRNTLVQLQSQVEKIAAEHPDNGPAQSVDFAHMLELAREFGTLDNSNNYDDDWLEEGSVNETTASFGISTPCGSFDLSTPRGEQEPVLQETNARLRTELEESRSEIAALRAALAEREAELVTLRAADATQKQDVVNA